MLLALTLSTNLVIPIASFIAIGALTWLILSFFASDDDRAGRRLQYRLQPRHAGANEDRGHRHLADHGGQSGGVSGTQPF